MDSLRLFLNNIKDDEKVLWKTQKITNELGDVRSFFFTLIFIVVPSFLVLFFAFFPVILEDLYALLAVLLLIFTISIFPLYMFLDVYVRKFKLSRRIGLHIFELRKYENFIILTNKRWIQKSIYVEECELKAFSNEKDIGWISLDDVRVLHTSPERKNGIYIHLFSSEDIDNEESNYSLSLKEEEFLDLLSNLQDLLKISRIESDRIFGGNLYYFNKKIS